MNVRRWVVIEEVAPGWAGTEPFDGGESVAGVCWTRRGAERLTAEWNAQTSRYAYRVARREP